MISIVYAKVRDEELRWSVYAATSMDNILLDLIEHNDYHENGQDNTDRCPKFDTTTLQQIIRRDYEIVDHIYEICTRTEQAQQLQDLTFLIEGEINVAFLYQTAEEPFID